MASCRRRAALPGVRPGRVAPAPPARQTFLPAAQNGIYRKNDTQLDPGGPLGDSLRSDVTWSTRESGKMDT